MVYCAKCGTQNEDDAAQCTKCGEPLGSTQRGSKNWEEEIEVRAEEFGERAESLAEEWKHVTGMMSVSGAETDQLGHLYLELSLYWLV